MNNSRPYLHWPILVCGSLAAGILIGASIFGSPSGRDDLAGNLSRMREILMYVQHDYVDTVNINKLSRHAIDGMLERLDPHSAYVPAEDMSVANAQLEADFDGIGVEFLVRKDTIEIISPLSGGPSDKVGIRPGDRVVKVNNENVAGVNITSNEVFNKLRGPKGSPVNIEIIRPSNNKLLHFTVKRDKIPTHSIDAALMAETGLGYIKISRFSATTDKEFTKAMKALRKQGMTRLVLDLRDNPGGYLDKAIKVADEFLPSGSKIVYTDGKADRYDATYNATSSGSFEKEPVTILLNEGSASAAEILAGALQDNDRALIVGRRSFGKGLVQMPITLSDGGELRLTISRYFTPSGRCIQKPYDGEHVADYDEDLDHRYTSGELFSADSFKLKDTVKYKTVGGRVVYGGGGISPDLFVPLDTVRNSAFLAEVLNEYIPQSIATSYAEFYRTELQAQGLERFCRTFAVNEHMLKQVVGQARKEKIHYTQKQWDTSKATIRTYIKAYIARSAFGENGYYAVTLPEDDIFQLAVAKGYHKKLAAK